MLRFNKSTALKYQAFLRWYDSVPTLMPPPLPSVICLSFSVFLCVADGRGRAWSRIIKLQENLALYISSILSRRRRCTQNKQLRCNSYGGFIKGILRGVRCTKSLRVLFLHRRPPSWTTLVLYSRAVFIFNEPAFTQILYSVHSYPQHIYTDIHTQSQIMVICAFFSDG